MTFYYWRIFPDKAIVNGEIYVLTVKSCRYTFFRFGGTICMICVKKSSVYGVFWSPPFFSFKYTVWCQIIYFYRLRDVPENIISTEMTSFPLCLTTDDIFHFMFFQIRCSVIHFLIFNSKCRIYHHRLEYVQITRPVLYINSSSLKFETKHTHSHKFRYFTPSSLYTAQKKDTQPWNIS